jgi:hypothetical protein
MSKNMNKRATENYILFWQFLTVSSVSSDSIVKGIIDDIINTAVKNAEVDEQITKYLQHFINKHDTIVVFAYFLCTVVLFTSEKIAYMYTFKIMFNTSVIQ